MRSFVVIVRGLVLALLWMAPTSAADPLVGTWSSTVDWGRGQRGLYSVLTIGAAGRLRVHVMNNMGMAYDMLGKYRMDARGRTMRYAWIDYAPKRICVGGNCTPMRSPQRLGVTHTSRIRFVTPNLFIGTTDDGASTRWTRTQ